MAEKRKRLAITASNDREMAKFERLLKALYPYLKPSTAAKTLMLYLADNIDATKELVTTGNQRSPMVSNGDQREPMVPCPGPARAPEQQQDRQTDIKSIKNGPETRLAEVAQAIRESDWYGATLPKSETPETYATKLLRTWADTSAQHVHEASMWLLNNPGKRKKYLGGFLTNWMRNAGKFAASPTHKQSLSSTSAQLGMGDDEGYTDGTW